MNAYFAAADAGAAAGTALLVVSVFFVFALVAVVLWLIVLWFVTLIHAIQHEDVPDRVLWIVLHLVVGSIIGPIYWFAVKKPYDRRTVTPPPIGKTEKN